MTPAEIEDLAAEIVLDLREFAFDGDKWINNPTGISVVTAVLNKYPQITGEQV